MNGRIIERGNEVEGEDNGDNSSSDDMTSDSTVLCRRREYLLGEINASMEGLSESMGECVSQFGRFYKTAVSNCICEEKRRSSEEWKGVVQVMQTMRLGLQEQMSRYAECIQSINRYLLQAQIDDIGVEGWEEEHIDIVVMYTHDEMNIKASILLLRFEDVLLKM